MVSLVLFLEKCFIIQKVNATNEPALFLVRKRRFISERLELLSVRVIASNF